MHACFVSTAAFWSCPFLSSGELLCALCCPQKPITPVGVTEEALFHPSEGTFFSPRGWCGLRGAAQLLKGFLTMAEADVRSLAALYADVSRNADGLSQYFGEDPNRCPFEQVTLILWNFMETFKRALDENVKQAELEKKKAEREAEKAKNPPPTPSKTPSRGGSRRKDEPKEPPSPALSTSKAPSVPSAPLSKS
eukprot:jgi/Mesen1/4520/ME000023S03891